MGVSEVLGFWKVRFAVALAVLGVVFSGVAVFLFPSQPRIAVILVTTEIAFIVLEAWAFWSILTSPPDIEKIKELLSK
jgi:hypothetical protein